MRNLSKTIDRILKIEPTLEGHLVPVKDKWEKTHRNSFYWKQLLKILNLQVPPTHPKRGQIQNIFISHKKIPKKIYTFEPPSPAETVIGIIPEHLECHLRRHDSLQIKYAKATLEARMTHNRLLMIDVLKKTEKLEIEQKRIWIEIKNHFNLWNVETATSYFVRLKDNLLVLTSIRLGGFPGSGGRPDQLPGGPPDGYFLKMDGDTLKKFFRMMNPPDPPEG